MCRVHFVDCSIFHSSQDMGPTYGSSAPGGLGKDSVTYIHSEVLHSLYKVGSLVICHITHKPGVDHVKRIKLGTE